MDEAIGRILDIIDSKGIADNTVVFFLSDNGGPSDAANNAPLRGDKATLWEGGIRVPSVIRWQKGGLVGGRKVNDFLCYIDVYPTFKRIVGLTEPGPHHVDGIDMLDILRGEATAPGREFYSYYDRAADDELLAINTPEWKLIRRGPAILEVDQGAEAEIDLFRIAEDPYENNNVSHLYPGVVKQLLAKVRAFRALRKPGGLPRQEERREGTEEGWERPLEWKALPDS
jgi:arylsulfatase A-like enzyme